MSPSQTATRLSWIAQIIAVLILGQTLFFKFSAAPESVALFSALHAEPFGRLGSGAIELLAVVLLLIPRTAVFGALLGLGVMSGALLSHLAVLGINWNGDGGLLFGLALIVFVCCAAVIILRRAELPFLRR
jgi:hypothetical protein